MGYTKSGLVVLFSLYLLREYSPADFRIRTALIVLGLGFFLAHLLDLLGHILVAHLSGLRLTHLNLGWWTLRSHKGSWRILRANHRLYGLGINFDPGHVLPRDVAPAWRRTLLAGPLLDVFAALAVAWCSLTIAMDRPGTQWRLIVVAEAFSIVAISSLWSGKNGFSLSDGAVYRMLRKGGPKAENSIHARRLLVHLAGPDRPRDWPNDLQPVVSMMLAASPDQIDPTSHAIAVEFVYWYYADRREPERALALLGNHVTPPKPGSDIYAGDPALGPRALLGLHLALFNRDLAQAEEIIDNIPKDSWAGGRGEAYMTRALVCLSKEKLDDARQEAENARDSLKRLKTHLGTAQLAAEWLEVVDQRIAAPIETAAPPAPIPVASPVDSFSAPAPPEIVEVEQPPQRQPISFPTPERTAWSVGAVAVNQSAGVHVQAVTAEYGFDRSWLYRTPGVPVEEKSRGGRMANPWATTPASQSESPRPQPHVASKAQAGPSQPAPVFLNPPARVEMPIYEHEPILIKENPVAALFKAIFSTVVLCLGFWFATFLYAATIVCFFPFAFDAWEGNASSFLGLGIGSVIAFFMALWIGEQTKWWWGVLAFFFLPIVYAVYVYKQNRGMAVRGSGRPVAKFPMMATIGIMIGIGIFTLVIGVFSVLRNYSDEIDRGVPPFDKYSLESPSREQPSSF